MSGLERLRALDQYALVAIYRSARAIMGNSAFRITLRFPYSLAAREITKRRSMKAHRVSAPSITPPTDLTVVVTPGLGPTPLCAGPGLILKPSIRLLSV